MDYRKMTLVAAAGAVLVFLLSLTVARSAFAGRAESAENRALELQGQVAGLQELSNHLQERFFEASQELDKSREEVKKWQSKVANAPRPAPPKPTPQSAPDLEGALVALGIKQGVRVALNSENPSQFSFDDAQRTYEWGQQFLRVPALEKRLDSLEGLTAEQEKALTLSNDSLNIQTDLNNNLNTQLSLSKEQAGSLQKAVVAEKKKGNVTKWLYAAGGLAAGWLARGK